MTDITTPSRPKTRPHVIFAMLTLGALALLGLRPTPETFGAANPVRFPDAAPVTDPTFEADQWLWLSVVERNTAPLAPLIRPLVQRAEKSAEAEASRGASWRNGVGWALGQAGYTVPLGTLVHEDLRPGADLAAGDIIVTVDGRPTPLPGLVRRFVNEALEAGRPAVGVVIRDGATITVELDPSSARRLNTVDGEAMATGSAWEPQMGFSSGGSAGLLFALSALDALTTGDLTGGKIVAATGTMYPDGAVGAIAGADWKLDAAFAAGADVVFVAHHSDDLERHAGDPRIVIVAHADEAVAWLCANGGTAVGVCP
jgi:hypothetical protein